jgi:hypothetical protein
MKHRLLLLSALCLLILPAAQAQSQQLTVQSEDGTQTVLKRADIQALPHVKVTTGSGGNAETFEGVALKSVLEKGGVVFGETMKGKRMASCLLVEAADGYRSVIALPELDPAFTDKQIMLAFLKEGKPLDDKEGPYRIVIPDEKGRRAGFGRLRY